MDWWVAEGGAGTLGPPGHGVPLERSPSPQGRQGHFGPRQGAASGARAQLRSLLLALPWAVRGAGPS